MKTYFVLLALLSAPISFATTWNVGPTETYTLPSQLVNLVEDGDSILIASGVYLNDASKWTKKNLTFIGLGTLANRTILRYSGDLPNGKGIFVFEIPVDSDNPTIINIVFDGAQVSDADGANGAGIRFQARNLTVRDCKFMNCQNGILEGNGSVIGSEVLIENSEFDNNGYQLPDDPTHSGYEHHLYIGASTTVFTLRNCYLHHPRGQANSIKTRALMNYIEYNFIDEGSTGYGSYELNIAQGGLCVVIGNVFIQGASGANHSIVGYDAVTNPMQNFYFVNNTVINRFAGNVRLFNITPSSGINAFKMYNNIFASVTGASNAWFGANTPAVLDSMKNVYATNYLNLNFLDGPNDNFHLTSGSTAAIDQATPAGTTNTMYPLTPYNQYVDFSLPLGLRSNIGLGMDIGAFEFTNGLGLSDEIHEPKFYVYPNPSNGEIIIQTEENVFAYNLVSLDGKNCVFERFDDESRVILKTKLPGVYVLQLTMSSGEVLSKKVIIE